MKKLLLVTIFAVFLCVSCAASIGPHGASIAIAPPLPVSVELYDPYYAYGGYHYYYHGDRWYYSQSKSGPWIDLPRDRYPKEIRYKGKGYGRDWEYERGRRGDKDWKHDKGRHDDKDWKHERGRGGDKDWKDERGRGGDKDWKRDRD